METILEHSLLYFLSAVFPWEKTGGQSLEDKEKVKKETYSKILPSAGKNFIIVLWESYLLLSFNCIKNEAEI